jgi:hypothetical protein
VSDAPRSVSVANSRRGFLLAWAAVQVSINSLMLKSHHGELIA